MPWQPAARRKFRSLPTLLRELRRVRPRGRRIVFTNGCFDLLHPGHTQLLERTKRLGDVLVVGLNSDRSVRMLKGAGRPIVAARDRAALLAALESVDYIVVFDDRTPRRLIAAIQPDVLVKGADWSAGGGGGGGGGRAPLRFAPPLCVGGWGGGGGGRGPGGRAPRGGPGGPWCGPAP